MVESVSALHNVHHQFGEAQVILGEQGIGGDRLDNVAHEEEPLRILKTAFCQISPRAVFLQGATLKNR